ncbi:MAG: hypothetical protein R2724_20710 [Bryobacterales bacterium]
MDRSLTIERLLGQVTGAFAGVALLLASVGLFGLMSYVVRQRTAKSAYGRRSEPRPMT